MDLKDDWVEAAVRQLGRKSIVFSMEKRIGKKARRRMGASMQLAVYQTQHLGCKRSFVYCSYADVACRNTFPCCASVDSNHNMFRAFFYMVLQYSTYACALCCLPSSRAYVYVFSSMGCFSIWRCLLYLFLPGKFVGKSKTPTGLNIS